MVQVVYDLIELNSLKIYIKYKKNTDYKLILNYLYNLGDGHVILLSHTDSKNKKEYPVLDLSKVDLTLYMVENLQ